MCGPETLAFFLSYSPNRFPIHPVHSAAGLYCRLITRLWSSDESLASWLPQGPDEGLIFTHNWYLGQQKNKHHHSTHCGPEVAFLFAYLWPGLIDWLIFLSIYLWEPLRWYGHRMPSPLRPAPAWLPHCSSAWVGGEGTWASMPFPFSFHLS